MKWTVSRPLLFTTPLPMIFLLALMRTWRLAPQLVRWAVTAYTLPLSLATLRASWAGARAPVVAVVALDP